MGFKKLFRKDDKAVSPVIGVILMVAITVILAAAIGSSVFGQGTTESAPQANLDIKAVSAYDSSKTGADAAAVVKIEHLGGDPINLATTSTKIIASVNGEEAKEVAPGSITTLGVGDVKTLGLMVNASTHVTGESDTDYIASGDIVNIKFIDITTSQIICDKDVRF